MNVLTMLSNALHNVLFLICILFLSLKQLDLQLPAQFHAAEAVLVVMHFLVGVPRLAVVKALYLLSTFLYP